jgi:hypothetical protein
LAVDDLVIYFREKEREKKVGKEKQKGEGKKIKGVGGRGGALE